MLDFSKFHGLWCKCLRKTFDIPMTDIAKELGVSTATISFFENGDEYRKPSKDTMKQIHRCLRLLIHAKYEDDIEISLRINAAKLLFAAETKKPYAFIISTKVCTQKEDILRDLAWDGNIDEGCDFV